MNIKKHLFPKLCILFYSIAILSCSDSSFECKDFSVIDNELNIINDARLSIKSSHNINIRTLKFSYSDESSMHNAWISGIDKIGGISHIYISTDRTFGWRHNLQLLYDDNNCHHASVVSVYKPSLNLESLQFQDDKILVDNEFHNAFTDLYEYNGARYLAFRQAGNHVPQNESEYGCIKIMCEDDQLWRNFATIQRSGWDLRDPKLYVCKDKLCVLCGYSLLVNSALEKQGTCISFFENGVFSEPVPISTDAEHVVWIWRMCYSGNKFLGIGYMEGYHPLLLESTDLTNWCVQSEIPVEGIPTEADLAVYENQVLVILRRDGETAYFCSKDINSKEWKCLDIGLQLDSPCIGYVDEQNILVSGRLYDNNRETGIVEYNYKQNTYRILDATSMKSPDCAYPGIIIRKGILLLSYYEGDTANSKIHLRTYKINNN